MTKVKGKKQVVGQWTTLIDHQQLLFLLLNYKKS